MCELVKTFVFSTQKIDKTHFGKKFYRPKYKTDTIENRDVMTAAYVEILARDTE